MAGDLITAVDICNRASQELGHGTFITTLAGTDKTSIAYNRIYADARDELTASHPWKFALRRREIEQNDNDRFSVLHTDGGWVVSAVATEYYLPKTALTSFKGQPDDVYENSTAMTLGTLGSLAAGEWGWGDNDSLGYETMYVRLTAGGDPDSQYSGDNDYLEIAYDDPDFEWDYALPIPGDALRIIRLFASGGGVAEQWVEEDRRILYSDDECNVIYIRQITDPQDFDEWYTRALIFKLAGMVCLHLTDSRELKAEMLAQFDDAIRKARRFNAISKNYRIERSQTSERPDTNWQAEGR